MKYFDHRLYYSIFLAQIEEKNGIKDYFICFLNPYQQKVINWRSTISLSAVHINRLLHRRAFQTSGNSVNILHLKQKLKYFEIFKNMNIFI